MRRSHLPPSSTQLNHGIVTKLGLWLCGQIADGTNARGPWEMRPAQRITATGLSGCER